MSITCFIYIVLRYLLICQKGHSFWKCVKVCKEMILSHFAKITNIIIESLCIYIDRNRAGSVHSYFIILLALIYLVKMKISQIPNFSFLWTKVVDYAHWQLQPKFFEFYRRILIFAHWRDLFEHESIVINARFAISFHLSDLLWIPRNKWYVIRHIVTF